MNHRYCTKKSILMLGILFASILFTNAQNFEIKVTDKPIPGVPLEKGKVLKVENLSDTSNVIDIQNLIPGNSSKEELNKILKPGKEPARVDLSKPAIKTVKARDSFNKGKIGKDIKTNFFQEVKEIEKEFIPGIEHSTGPLNSSLNRESLIKPAKKSVTTGFDAYEYQPDGQNSGVIRYKLTHEQLDSMKLGDSGLLTLSTTNDYSIPDNNYFWIYFTPGATIPADAYVTDVQYTLKIDDNGDEFNFWAIDYDIYLSSGINGAPNMYHSVYKNLGGMTDGGYDDDTADDSDIYLYQRSSSIFNGETPDQIWSLWINDDFSGGEGFLDYLYFDIYWETPSTTLPNLIADYTPSGWDDPIVVSSVTGTNTDGPDLQYGETAYIDFAFINRDADIPDGNNIYVYLYENETYIHGWYWDGMLQNYYGYVEDYAYVFANCDWVNVESNVDPSDLIAESNESDNVYSRDIYIECGTILPNLIADYTPSGWDDPIVVSSVTGTNTDGPDLQYGETAYIDFAFINRDADIPDGNNIYVYLYENETYIHGWYWDGMLQNYYGYVEDYAYVFANCDWVNVESNVDPSDLIAESNESDNVYSRDIYIECGTILPNLIADYTPNGWDDPIVLSAVTGTHTDDPYILHGETGYIDFAFVNRNADIPSGNNVYVYLYDNDTYYNGYYWDGIQKDYYGYVEDIAYTIEAGPHTFKTVVDPDNLISESNEGDNEYERTMVLDIPDIFVNPVNINIYEESSAQPKTYKPNVRLTSGNKLNEYGTGLIIPERVKEYWKSRKPIVSYDKRNLKASIDWSVSDSPVKSQGGCGSCWAFGSMALVENIGGESDLSEQVLVSCAAGDCDGGYITDALEYIKDDGVPTESCYPYLELNGNCNDKCINPSYSAKITSYTELWGTGITPDDIKAALQNGPIVAAFSVPQDGTFHSYSGGIYDYDGGTYSWHGHAILIVGYDDNEEYFKFKNSWGTDWGESGYCRIAYNDVYDNVEFGIYACSASGFYIDGNPIETNQFTITDVGTGRLEVYDIHADRNWISFSPEVPPDLYIYPGNSDTITFSIDWNQVPYPSDQATVTIASDDPDEGEVYVYVNAYTEGVYPPDVPVLSSPVNGATDQLTSLDLVWYSSLNTDSYNLQVDDDSDFSSPEFEYSGLTDTSQSISGLSISTTYYWRVNAENIDGTSPWSGTWHFTTIVYAPDAPTLLSPVNGATDQPTSLSLTWNTSVNADFYNLQVDDNNDFSSPEFEYSGLTDTSQSISGLSISTTYYWRVNAENAGGPSIWSIPWYFTTLSGAPDIPVLTLPANGALNQPTSLWLQWSASDGALTYDLQVDDDYNFSSPIENQTGITDTVYQVSGLNDNTLHYWRVRSVNTHGASLWSEIWLFTTANEVLIEPELTYPANEATNMLSSILFIWNPVVDAMYYRLQISDNIQFSDPIVDHDNISGTLQIESGLPGNATLFWKVLAFNNDGMSPWSNVWGFTTKNVTSTTVTENGGYKLYQNHPNPFSDQTIIEFNIPSGQDVRLVIFSIEGKIIRDYKETLPAGRNTYIFNASDVDPGIYFYRMQTGDFIQTNKLNLVK